MAQIKTKSITIEYDETGSRNDPALLLVCGFGGQMTSWPDSFKKTLADAGRRVITFDNRDVGLSTELAEHAPASPRDIITALAQGKSATDLVPYVLDDMAADAANLLDELNVDQADVFGVSMGGMIVQLMALNHPEKVRNLIPVMTTSGDPSLPQGEPDALAALTTVPETRTHEALADQAVISRRAIGSHADIRSPDEDVRKKALAAILRSDRPLGVARQYAAILAQPRWHDRLSGVTHPTFVLHGAMDPLIKPAAGQDIADRIPGAKIEIFEKWGHDLPEAMVPTLADRVSSFIS